MSRENIPFNYIVTIHNKENLIKDVILGVMSSAGPNSKIYPVFDGCTDASEKIVDQLIKAYPEVSIIKLFANDVHELKTINVGLRAASQHGRGYNIILQDDVVLRDGTLEEKCINLYHAFEHLGIVSFRHGGNLSRELILDESCLNPLQDYIQSECGHYPNPNALLKIGSFVFREAVIKSPICVPFKIIRELGPPDEAYAPWDDHAYTYKVSQAGYANGVFGIDFVSHVSWGTTRNKIQEIQVEAVQRKNLDLFRKNNPEVAPLDRNKYNYNEYQILPSRTV